MSIKDMFQLFRNREQQAEESQLQKQGRKEKRTSCLRRSATTAAIAISIAAGAIAAPEKAHAAITSPYDAYTAILTAYANDINKAEKFNILEVRGMPIYIGDLTGDGNPELAFLAAYAGSTATGETLRIYSCDSGYVQLICEENFGGGIDHREYKVMFQTNDNSLYVASFMEGAYGEDTESYYKLLPDEEGFYEVSSDGIQRTHTDSVSYSYTEGYTAETFETSANDIVAAAKTVILCNMASNSSNIDRSTHLVSMAVNSGAVGYADAQTILGGDPQLPYITKSNGYEYILPNSDRRYLSEEKISSLTDDELRLARNEIFARYNCMFEDTSLEEYFRKYSWYDGYGWYSAKDLPSSELNEYENHNLDLILAEENRRAGQ